MKPFLMFVLLCFLTATPELRAQSKSADDEFFDVYSTIIKANRLEDKGKKDAAMTNYVAARKELKQLQQDYPLWNTKVVKYRLGYLDSKISPPAEKPATKEQEPAHHTTSGSEMEDKAADNGQAVALKLKWQTGKRYEEQLKLAFNVNQTMPGQGQPIKQELALTQGLAMSVLKEMDGGGHELELELLDTLLDAKSGGMTMMSYDSKQPSTADAAANPALGMLKNVKGAKLKLTMDANGRPQSVEGLTEFLTKILGPDGKQAADSLTNLPGMADNWKDMMASSSGLPDKPVKVGDSWTRNNSIDAGGTSVAQNMTYNFTGWETHDDHKCAVIQYSGKISPKPSGAMPMNMNISVSGTVWFDPDLGTTVETDTKIGMLMQMAMGNQAMNMNLNGNVSAKLIAMTDIPQ